MAKVREEEFRYNRIERYRCTGNGYYAVVFEGTLLGAQSRQLIAATSLRALVRSKRRHQKVVISPTANCGKPLGASTLF